MQTIDSRRGKYLHFHLLSIVLVFSSCTNGPHIRGSAPTRVEIIQAPYQDLANCVAGKINASGVAKELRISVDKLQKQARVFEPFGFVHDTKTFEFLFVETKENETKVESYGFETLVGRDHYPNQVWPFVLECGNQDEGFHS